MLLETALTKLNDFTEGEKKVLVVEDDDIVRMYLECLLSEHGCRVTAKPDFSGVKKAFSNQNYDLIIADLVFVGKEYSGLDIVEYAKSVCRKCKAIILTSYPSTHTAVKALRLQAVDYLTKPARQEEILSAVSKALTDYEDTQPAKVSRVNDSGQLTNREKEVLGYLYKGYSYTELAIAIGCSPFTARTHGRRIYRKLGVNSRSEAVYKALNQGLIKRN